MRAVSSPPGALGISSSFLLRSARESSASTRNRGHSDDRFRFVTRNLSWSPDGGRIAFEHNDESDRPGIFVMNADGTNAQRLTNGESPSWSDGLALAFTSNRDGNSEIYVMNADGSNQRNISRSPKPDREPRWAPRG
jgi:Tol biopolymer transport system component